VQFQAFTQVFDELLRERQFSRAVTLCDQALSTRLSPTQKCRLLQLKAEAFSAGGREYEGPVLACLREAYSASRPNSLERARVLTAMTAAYASLTSPTNCCEARNELLQIISERSSPKIMSLLPHAEFNLAYTYHEHNDLEAAEDAYLSALKACVGLANSTTNFLKLKINFNLIDVFQERDRHEDAHTIMEHVFPRLDEALHGAMMSNRRAAYALWAGDTASAILWVEGGLGHGNCDAKTRAALILTKARIALSAGSEDKARDYALEAKRLAKEAECNRLVVRALRFLDQVPKGV
jgi:hypothetical protein